MDARKCYRCGKLYEKYRNELDGIVEPNGIFYAKRYDDDSYFPSKWFNLCPECMDELKKMDRRRGNDRKRTRNQYDPDDGKSDYVRSKANYYDKRRSTITGQRRNYWRNVCVLEKRSRDN